MKPHVEEKTWKRRLSNRLNNVKTRIQNSLHEKEQWCSAYDVPPHKMQLLWVSEMYLLFEKNIATNRQLLSI